MIKKLICMLLLLVLFSSFAIADITHTITKSGWLGVWNKDHFDSMVMRMEDTEVLRKMMDAGQIFLIKQGLEVYIESSTWLGAVELRPRGEVYTFWTFHEAIE